MDTDFILLEKFANSHPLQAAQTIEGFTEEEIASVLNEFPADLLIGVVKMMNRYKVASCLKLIKPPHVIAIIEKMDVQASELILRQCDENFRNEILSNISTQRSSVLQQKLQYKAFTIGSLMDPVIFSLKKEQTVKEAINMMKQGKKKSSAEIPVVNIEGNLEGLVKIHDLLLAEKSNLIESIMKTEIPKFSANMLIKSVVINPKWYEYQIIPVTDSYDKLIGILNFESVHKHKIASDAEHLNLTTETASSLGELYRIGLSGFLQSIGK